MSYAELFCQSNFSFLTGASRPEELVKQADFLGYSAIAITDECSLAGIVRAHAYIQEHKLKIKLIIGSLLKYQNIKFVAICPNQLAYSELCRVISNARRRSEKGAYQLSEWDIMSLKHVLLLWLPQGNIQDTQSVQWLCKYHHDRVWIAYQRKLAVEDDRYFAHCIKLAKAYHIPLCAVGGVLMHCPSRLALQHTLTAIRLNRVISDIPEFMISNAEFALRPIPKLKKLYALSLLEESEHIARQCDFNLSNLAYQYPQELVPQGLTPMAYLRSLVEKGKKTRFPDGVPPEIAATIEKELALIEALNYPFFFITIHDIVMYAKQHDILYQGRGSAANSVVCYCLEITAVDPRQVGVLFERFISKERNEPPDIDVDFEHQRREEVIQYIYNKYGRKRAALAATVITYRLKSAMRDVGKALGIEMAQIEYFIKHLNRRDKGLNWQAQLVELGFEPSSLKGQHFIQLVNEIIGFPRHLSQHVGGFVISQSPLHELVPTENAAMPERTIIQWDKDDLETLKLLKVDVLALGMLSAIRKCFGYIAQHTDKSLDLAQLTRMQDDPLVYKMLQKGDSIGVFQVESRAQMSMLPRLKPACYYDLVIQIAIVRPGPIQGDMVHPFLKRREGEEQVSYPSEAVKSVLERTMGVPIFQEQVIKLAMVAAGFTGGEADSLRRAMASWKKTGELMQFKEKLIRGMLERGYEAQFAERIFEQICGFGEYGFPESHSASFAVLAYASAWLKYYYPAMFYTALLNSLPMGFYSASQLLQDAARHNVTILPICINHSDYHHLVVKADNTNTFAIRLGLRLIKGLSEAEAQHITQQRPDSGFHRIAQLQQVGIAKSTIEKLISADALHRFVDSRYAARWSLADQSRALPLFVELEESAPQYNHFQTSEFEELREDYNTTKVSLRTHPVKQLEQAKLISRTVKANELLYRTHKSLVTVVGLVTGKQSPGTAKGVTFFTLEDETGNMNVIVWSGTARAQKQAYMGAQLLEVKGILEKEGEVVHVIAGKLIDRTELLEAMTIKARAFR
ncbi:error-prone DNA polymerase [Pseudoalteromonas sp. McH1-7]|uniref:error-prone DNA polymerase n=1 Tax=Pseudoalteromonas sp. McH1-7 TaxID=2745574 RepID=UPI0015925B34|nr:error-prone DNA polymerase [Pseudoalteromonas sp. McH1-7]NUZ13242.1 error-prone DNA polymerase [Pseudoalteromonas sp. McH1-7]